MRAWSLLSLSGLLAGALMLGACAGGASSQAAAELSLAPEAFQQALAADPSVQLVDVRQPEEYAEGHLKGAKLLPLGELPARLAELDKSRPVLLYCRSGKRSARALDLALRAGFKARHLAGGVNAWDGAGLPLER